MAARIAIGSLGTLSYDVFVHANGLAWLVDANGHAAAGRPVKVNASPRVQVRQAGFCWGRLISHCLALPCLASVIYGCHVDKALPTLQSSSRAEPTRLMPLLDGRRYVKPVRGNMALGLAMHNEKARTVQIGAWIFMRFSFSFSCFAGWSMRGSGWLDNDIVSTPLQYLLFQAVGQFHGLLQDTQGWLPRVSCNSRLFASFFAFFCFSLAGIALSVSSPVTYLLRSGKWASSYHRDMQTKSRNSR